MTENMKKLLECLSEKKEYCDKLNTMSRDEIIALAKELGFELTETELSQPEELSDDELDAVAGAGRCICSFGGGKAGEGEKTCACVMGGGGEYSDGSVRASASSVATVTGKRLFIHFNPECQRDARTRVTTPVK